MVTHGAHQLHGTDLIGRPILFVTGQFAGQTIRAQLREVQQADLGRKYARVDRRPLDPPPVVHLRLFAVYDAGTDKEEEKEIQNYEEIQVLGLLCTVDLFPMPPTDTHNKNQRLQSAPPTQASFPSSSSQYPMEHSQQPFTFIPSHAYSMNQSLTDALMPSPTRSTLPPDSGYMSSSQTAPDVVQYVNGFPIRESSKMTSSLVGATFVQPAIVEYQGRKSVMFVFADLAVKVEGTFILRYRVFDIFSRPHNYVDLAVQAECYGGSFHVYSTKEFPGLQASTDLTKHLARWGVRLNTRETERRRRKKGPRSASPRYTGIGKRKYPSPNDETLTAYESEDD
ncbi:velvet factor-domain-containing protein [Lyophyllum atratum]|nr:velvet factor-domain-containing protein [Lyophyllum atratum]